MYESLKNRIAALEEEEVLEEEEERRFGTHTNLSISRGFPIISLQLRRLRNPSRVWKRMLFIANT